MNKNTKTRVLETKSAGLAMAEAHQKITTPKVNEVKNDNKNTSKIMDIDSQRNKHANKDKQNK